MSDTKEREHCLAVARTMRRVATTHMALTLHEREVADFIARERAAAREQALEEAARACEEYAAGAVGADGDGANGCAEAIRALKAAKPSQAAPGLAEAPKGVADTATGVRVLRGTLKRVLGALEAVTYDVRPGDSPREVSEALQDGLDALEYTKRFGP